MTIRSTAIALLLVCGCSSADPAADPEPLPDWDVQINTAPCGFGEPAAATIDISERYDIWHQGQFSRIEGRVLSDVAPTYHDVVMTEGSCRYLKLAAGSCASGCETPEEISGGTLSIKGLGDRIDIHAESFAPGTYHGPSDLPAELFDASAEIGARLSGGNIRLGAPGVAAVGDDLVASGYEMTDGQDAEITWTPGPDPQACVRLTLNGFSTAHGLPLQDIIECEGTDTGSMTIPQALVEAYPVGETPDVTSNFDWPHSQLTRYTRAVDEGPSGPVELTIRSTAYFLVSHP